MVRIVTRRPGVRTPRLVSQGGEIAQISNPLNGLGGALQSAIDERDARKRTQQAADKREELTQRERADAAAAARAVADFRLRQGGELDRRAGEYDGTAPGFAADEDRRYRASVEAFLESEVPEHLRERIGATLMGSALLQHGLAAQSIESARTSERALLGASETVDLVANGVADDPASLAAALEGVSAAAEGLPPALQPRFIEEQGARVAASWFGAMLRQDPASAEAMLARGDLDGIIEPEQKNRWLTAAQNEQERRARVARAEAARAEADAARRENEAYQRLRVQYARGEIGLAQIEEAFDEGEIGINHWASLAVAAEQAEQAALEAQAEADLLLNGSVFDPSDPDHRDAADTAWRRILSENGGEDAFAANPGEFRADMVAFTQRYGIVPETAVTALRGLAANGPPEQQAAALSTISAISTVRETAASVAFSSDLVADAARYAQYATAGLEPLDALARVQTDRAARREGTVSQVLMGQANDWLDDRLSVGWLRAELDRVPVPFVGRPDFGGAPGEAAALASYRQLFRSHYATHGDADVARAETAAVMSRVWGQSATAGQYMPYPPERFYAVPGHGTGWMEDQLEAGVREHHGGEVDDIRLVADQITAREAQAGGAPSYRVTYADENGALQAVPGRWRFDSTAVRDEAQREAETGVSQARARREARMADLPFEELQMLERRADRVNFPDQERRIRARIEELRGEIGDEALAEWEARQARLAEFDPEF